MFLANGGQGSAAAERATRFAAAAPYPSHVILRCGSRRNSIRTMIRQIRNRRPDLIYCVDLALVPLLVSVIGRPSARLVVDTGDYPSAFLAHVGASRGRIAAARLMEEWAYRRADAFVVRGFHHAAVLRGQGVREIHVIPDGVDLRLAGQPADVTLRRHLGLSDVLTVGISGHFTWYDELGGGLGSELIRMLALLPHLNVHGILIGDGVGLPHLHRLATKLNVKDRLHFFSQIPYGEYFRYLKLIDVCLLTQTNDRASWVRTTGKLPAYMAAERYILSSAVGTAESLLPSCMLVPYHGSWDDDYPQRLAVRVGGVVKDPGLLEQGRQLRPLAADFDYDRLADLAGTLISALLDGISI